MWTKIARWPIICFKNNHLSRWNCFEKSLYKIRVTKQKKNICFKRTIELMTYLYITNKKDDFTKGVDFECRTNRNRKNRNRTNRINFALWKARSETYLFEMSFLNVQWKSKARSWHFVPGPPGGGRNRWADWGFSSYAALSSPNRIEGGLRPLNPGSI